MGFREKSTGILERAMAHIQSVSYQVSARWVFYRLLQDGLYYSKENYAGFLALLSQARKQFYKEWRPDTLADETRKAIVQRGRFATADEWLLAMARNKCRLDEWYEQPYYCEVWFEAQAMQQQFEHYSKHVTLRPFRGDPSIPYKWSIAKELEDAYETYEHEIVILYFGDLDKKGLQIPNSALSDIRAWCNVPFEFIHCGLNEEQVEEYAIPENPEKPGEYQWEALDDFSAGQIIANSLDEYLDDEGFDHTTTREQEATEEFQKMLLGEKKSTN